MLAPMQGLTNRSMRTLFIEWVQPDVVFTEFMRVSSVSRKCLAPRDLQEVVDTRCPTPLIAQLVGNDVLALTSAARIAQAAGARHINLNMGCPYGRMGSGATGGAMLQKPAPLNELIPALREAVTGSFSIKLRAGYSDPEQVFGLLPLFEKSAVDFLILHPRTVVQKYTGAADHSITARVVKETRLPVIANGDIRSAADGLKILEETRAAGLMLGRGAIADPTLFSRLRSGSATEPTAEQSAAMLHRYLTELLRRYSELFCGDKQILDKVKNVLAFIDDPVFAKLIGKMKRVNSIPSLTALIARLGETDGHNSGN